MRYIEIETYVNKRVLKRINSICAKHNFKSANQLLKTLTFCFVRAANKCEEIQPDYIEMFAVDREEDIKGFINRFNKLQKSEIIEIAVNIIQSALDVLSEAELYKCHTSRNALLSEVIEILEDYPFETTKQGYKLLYKTFEPINAILTKKHTARYTQALYFETVEFMRDNLENALSILIDD